MKKKRVKINIQVTEEFWESWKEFAGSQGMTAGQLFEVTGRAMISSSKGIFNVLDQIFEMGVLQGKGKLDFEKGK